MSESKKNYSKYDHMSTELLEEILKEDFQADDTESDIDEILYIMEVIDQRKRDELSDDYPDAHKAWGDFNKNYRPISDSDSLYGEDEPKDIPSTESVKVKKKRPLRRWIGVAAAVAVVVGTLSVASTTATGSSLW